MLGVFTLILAFSLNGELMMDRLGQEIAFKGIDLDDAFVPAFSLSPGQQGKLNFGQVIYIYIYIYEINGGKQLRTYLSVYIRNHCCNLLNAYLCNSRM